MLLADTIVEGTIFNPDPLTTAGVTYGAPYIDDSDNDYFEINQEIELLKSENQHLKERLEKLEAIVQVLAK